MLGEGYLRLRWRDVEATLFRHELDLPYVNRNDSRMAPNSFQGVTAKGIARGVPWLHRVDWVAGYLTDIRPRNDQEFISMSEQAGALGTDEGMLLAGVQFKPLENLSLGGYNYLVTNTFNTAYLAGDYLWKLNADWATRFQGQFTHQASVGDELIGSFRTWVASGRVAASFRGITGWLAFSKTDDGRANPQPLRKLRRLHLADAERLQPGRRARLVGGALRRAEGHSRLERILPVRPRRRRLRSTDVRGGRGRAGVRPHGGLPDQGGSLARLLAAPSRIAAGYRGRGNTAWQVRAILNYTIPIL